MGRCVPQIMDALYLVWIGELELPAVSGPGDDVLQGPVRQQLQQELPQLDGACSTTVH